MPSRGVPSFCSYCIHLSSAQDSLAGSKGCCETCRVTYATPCLASAPGSRLPQFSTLQLQANQLAAWPAGKQYARSQRSRWEANVCARRPLSCTVFEKSKMTSSVVFSIGLPMGLLTYDNDMGQEGTQTSGTNILVKAALDLA